MIINFFLSMGFKGDYTDYEKVLSYFDFYINSSIYFKEYYSGKFILFYGQIYFSDFWSLIPRGLFPDKPYVYGITYVNEYFFPGAAAESNTPAFGGPISYYADLVF